MAILVGCAALLAAALGPAAGATRSMPPADDRMDIIIRGGTIVDGTGSPSYKADLGIDGGHIAAIGDLGEHAARTDIDATRNGRQWFRATLIPQDRTGY